MPSLTHFLDNEAPTIATAIAAIRADLFPRDDHDNPIADAGLNGVFEPVSDSSITYLPELAQDDLRPLLGHAVSAVPWQATLKHVGSFRGIHASERRVVIAGVSLLDLNEGQGVIRRFINWEEVMAQIGVVYAARGATTTEPPAPSPS